MCTAAAVRLYLATTSVVLYTLVATISPPCPFPRLKFCFLQHTCTLERIVGPAGRYIIFRSNLKRVPPESAANLLVTSTAKHLSYHKVAPELTDRNGVTHHNMTPGIVQTVICCIAPVSQNDTRHRRAARCCAICRPCCISMCLTEILLALTGRMVTLPLQPQPCWESWSK